MNFVKLKLLFIFTAFFFGNCLANNIRQISNKEGLSNSAILSMCQDKEGFMWFGSCDGVNLFDGLHIDVYNSINEKTNFSGSIIKKIIEVEDGTLWVHTNYGLDHFDKRNKSLQSFKQFTGDYYFIAKSKKNIIFIINDNNKIHYYHKKSDEFKTIKMENLTYENVVGLTSDQNGDLWIFTKDGVIRKYSILDKENGELGLEFSNTMEHNLPFLYCLEDEYTTYVVDTNYDLYCINRQKNTKKFIYNLKKNILENGEILSLVKYSGDYFIGYKSNGLYRLQTHQGTITGEPEKMNIQSGIFCMLKDRFQDILWIGTDGQGIFMYYNDEYTIRSMTSNMYFSQIEKPLRAIFLDNQNTLWIGTKGDGIVKIPDFHFDNDNGTKKKEYITSSNSTLKDNSVYAFAQSRRNILWIGTEEGINYYSYKNKSLIKFDIKADDNKDVIFVHSIVELNDSTLWIATVGTGIVKVGLSWNKDIPFVKSAKRIYIKDKQFSNNLYFTAYEEDSCSVWFGNRGFGAFNIKSGKNEFHQVLIDKKNENQALNDIFCIQKDRAGNFWFGTSAGLVKYSPDNEKIKIFNTNYGFANNMIHGMLEDSKNNLWLSTNQGLLKFNTGNETFRVYNQTAGLEIIEFSDGAFFKDTNRGTLYFGGINGLSGIEENNYKPKEYTPLIQLNKLTIFGVEYNINDYISKQDNKESLVLNYSQNFFSISFTAIDYINGNNYSYFYKLNNSGSSWINNGNSNSIPFTNVSPGESNLLIKYRNNTTGKESPVFSMLIKVNPPWYSSTIAYFIYILAILTLSLFIIREIIIRSNNKKNRMLEKLKQEHEVEVYESKLKFFTNIAHEFCTPLTLIYGPCSRILSHSGSDKFVIKYTELIQRNAERLNNLIQDLIEFRRIETGNRPLHVESVAINNLIENISSSFNDLSESLNINIVKTIQAPLQWNTDKQFLEIIITNLVSNAFKYSIDNHAIKINACITDDMLEISISNKGKGILEREIKKAFDRYSILDNFENQNAKNVSSRNGLGLAITHSMVTLLNGTIDVKSVPNERTEFIVRLPDIPLDSQTKEQSKLLPPLRLKKEYESPLKLPQYKFDKFKSTILIIDDDIEILWLISEIFVDSYNVIPMNDSIEAKKLLETTHPDIIICDIMIPKLDGISLVVDIKANPKTAHIPIILVSAKHSIEEQIEGIDAGAEMYVTKPFNVEYLKKIIKRSMAQKETLKNYLSSPLSAFDFVDGKMTHKESHQFVQNMLDVINKNINNKDLSAKFIANEMSIGLRQMYRKLAEITDQSPLDMIRESRLHIAQNLLTSTKMTVDEIVYKSGFQTKGAFFKTFSAKFGCTPGEYRERESKKER